MPKYVARRLLWMLPTLFGITLICFLIINMAPGGPVEQALFNLRMSGHAMSAGVTDEVVNALKLQYGFDKPLHERYLIWLKNIATLDFGSSFSYQRPAIQVIAEKLTVSLQFGILSLIAIYLLSIPLGISKAVRDGSSFDVWTSAGLLVTYSIPPLILGILLRVYFAGGQFLDIFPLGELYSDNYFELSAWGKFIDRARHFALPLTCYVLGGFAIVTFLMKNSLMEEIRLDYVRTARAKGVSERRVILAHALRNALIPLLTGLGSFFTAFFAGSIVIEQIFNLDGMGLLSYKSVLSRDYNVIMGLIFIESVLAMAGRLIADIAYVWADPRIDFE